MQKNNTAALLLIEIILSVFFFALASTVCVQFYLRAQKDSDLAGRRSQAVILSQTVAESFLASGGSVPECMALLSELPDISCTETEDGKGVSAKQDSGLKAVLKVTEKPLLADGVISVYDPENGISLAELHVKVFTGGGDAQKD